MSEDDLTPDDQEVPAEEATDESLDSDSQVDLGVLLVHGIGQSHSGDTLSRFGEPIVNWVVDWVGDVAEAKVKVLDAVLGVEAEDPSVPAHTRLQISGPAQDGSGNESKQWLIAESWWAESFMTPSFKDIFKWGSTVVPWTAFYHFRRRLSRAGTRFAETRDARPRHLKHILVSSLGVVLEFLAVIAALLLAPIMVAILALLLLLGLIPIPRLRQFVAWLQRGLALTIGDTYALLGPKIGSAAIYGRVGRELDWLEKRSKRVAVIAHSQGAAVAYRVVSRRKPDKCNLLITFGAGIRKLAQIRLLDESRGSWVVWTAGSIIFFVIAALISRESLGIWQGLLLAVIVPAVWFIASVLLGVVFGIVKFIRSAAASKLKAKLDKHQTTFGLLLMAATAIAIALWLPGASRVTTIWVTLLVSFSWGWLLFAYQMAGQAAKNIAVMDLPDVGRAKPATEDSLPDSVRWIDLYATNDPVPNGPIFDDQVVDPVTLRSTSAGLESVVVHNRNSFLLDHTSYWQNVEDFIAEIVGALGAECGLKLFEVLPLDKERVTVARHRRRWRVRWLSRARWFVFASALAVWAWSDIEHYAVVLIDAMIRLLSAMPWLGKLLGLILPESSAATTTTVVATLGLGIFTALGMVNLGWLFWEKQDRAVLAGRHWYPGSDAKPHPALLFHFTWVLTVAVALVLVFNWISWSWWVYALVLFGLLLVAGGIAGGADTFGYVGGILKTWPELLQRNGLWTSQTAEDWAVKKRKVMIALIDPVHSAEGKTVWQASIVLVWRPHEPDRMVRYSVFLADTVREAAAWSSSHVDRVFAATGDQRYVVTDTLLHGEGDHGEVLEFWTRVIEHAETSNAQRAEAYLNRAHRKAVSGHESKALADYTAVIDMPGSPVMEHAKALNQRGGIAQTSGNFSDAIADYSAVIDLPDAPTFQVAQALLGRGSCHSAEDDMKAAAADYSSVVALTGAEKDQIANAYGNRGWIAYQNGDTKSFYEDTKLAIEQDLQNTVIGFNMGLSALLTRRLEQALEYYRTYAEKCVNPDFLMAAIQDIEDAAQKDASIDGIDEVRGILMTRHTDVTEKA